MNKFDAVSQAVDDHNRSNDAPSVVRNALLTGARDVAGISLQPLTLGTMLLLEKVANPEITGGGTQTYQDIARSLYIFAHPIESNALLQHGVDHFDREIFPWVAQHINFADLAAIAQTIREIIEEGQSTAPGQAATTRSDSTQEGSSDPLAKSR